MTKDDRLRWNKVAATVNPINPQTPAMALALDAAANATVAAASGPRRSLAPMPLPVTPAALDLHGLTVNDAYRAARDFIATTRRKRVTVITGKSGQIRREFTRWMEGLVRVHSVTEQNDGGAFSVRILKKHR